MSSLIPNSDKVGLADVFNSLHDTFARPVTMFKSSQEVVIQSSPQNNIFFPDAPTNDVVQNVIVSGMFNARIQYAPKEDLKFLSALMGAGGSDQITLKTLEGIVRVKLDPTGAAYLQDAQKVRFDNNIYEVFTDSRPHGLFTPNFYTFFLKRTN